MSNVSSTTPSSNQEKLQKQHSQTFNPMLTSSRDHIVAGNYVHQEQFSANAAPTALPSQLKTDATASPVLPPLTPTFSTLNGSYKSDKVCFHCQCKLVLEKRRA